VACNSVNGLQGLKFQKIEIFAENFIQNSRSLDRDVDPATHTYKAGVPDIINCYSVTHVSEPGFQLD
jgi:hypothetical protein